MVLVQKPDGSLEIGTGFFVTPTLIATNRHVIEDGRAGRIVVVNVKLEHPLAAQVTAATPNSDIGSLDLALLKVAPQVGIQPLSFTTTVSELDLVIAAGYPALVTRAEGAMQRLLEQGDASAAPQLVMTDGRINAIQTSPEGVKIMPHGASVSGGNSGGPLVDACGRVVGINTFIRADSESAAHANFAQKTDSLLAFFRDNGAAVQDVPGPCAPGTPVVPLTPAAAPAGLPPAPHSCLHTGPLPRHLRRRRPCRPADPARMATVHIATTHGQAFQALGTAGQSASDSWNTLSSLLGQRLGPEYARMIAEPATNPHAGRDGLVCRIRCPRSARSRRSRPRIRPRPGSSCRDWRRTRSRSRRR